MVGAGEMAELSLSQIPGIRMAVEKHDRLSRASGDIVEPDAIYSGDLVCKHGFSLLSESHATSAQRS